MGITVINYHTDNGVFTAAEYQDELAKLGQGMTLSGVVAHYQNAVTETDWHQLRHPLGLQHLLLCYLIYYQYS